MTFAEWRELWIWLKLEFKARLESLDHNSSLVRDSFNPIQTGGGFWGPRQLWRFITSWRLKLLPPNLASFPKNLWEYFGFWGPRQLWRFITSWPLKLSPPNLATFPKTLLGIFWHLHHMTTNFDVSMATSFWQPCFPIFAFSVLINIISKVYGVICRF